MVVKPKSNRTQKGLNFQQQILIAGMGGEGVVLVGELLGLGATLEGKFASQHNSYGASQRGEAICTEIIISDIPVRFPFIESPTHFIGLSKMGYDGYHYRLNNALRPIVYLDTSFDFDLSGLQKRAKVIKIPARKKAMETGIPTSANLIMLGGFVKETKIITQDSLERVLSDKMSKSSFKQNLKAARLGYKMV